MASPSARDVSGLDTEAGKVSSVPRDSGRVSIDMCQSSEVIDNGLTPGKGKQGVREKTDSKPRSRKKSDVAVIETDGAQPQVSIQKGKKFSASKKEVQALIEKSLGDFKSTFQ